MRAWLLVLLLVPGATAHDDRHVVDGTHELAPGASVTWERDVHWHRLMGEVDSDVPVRLTVEGDGTATVAEGTTLVVDHLVACCRNATWTTYTFRLTNIGHDSATAQVDLSLLHDNLIVLAADAEPGGWWQTLLIIALIIGIPAMRARRSASGDPGQWLRASRLLHGAAWAGGGLLAIVGMVRFGSGPLVGSLGATQPWPSGALGFLNTHAFVMLGLMALWGASVACWGAARRRTGPRSHPWDGTAFAAGSLLIGVLLAVESGYWVLPLTLGALPAAGLLADAWRPARGAA